MRNGRQKMRVVHIKRVTWRQQHHSIGRRWAIVQMCMQMSDLDENTRAEKTENE